MVQQVADKVERHGVTSRFKVALAWESTTDLDAWVVVEETGEAVGYSNLASRDGNTRLDFDANACRPTKQPVENFSLGDKEPGSYSFYVNNYATRGDPRDKTIDFTVVVNLDGEVSTFADSWDVKKRGENQNSAINRMMHITTIDITQAMIDQKVTPEMSLKQANRFQELRPQFVEKFGDVKAEVVDVDTVGGAVLLDGTVPGSSCSVLDQLNQMAHASKDRAALTSKKTRSRVAERSGSPQTLGDLIESVKSPAGKEVTIDLRGRDYPPSYLTTSSCAGNLTADMVANTYYEENRAPRQPDPNATLDNCR